MTLDFVFRGIVLPLMLLTLVPVLVHEIRELWSECRSPGSDAATHPHAHGLARITSRPTASDAESPE